MRRTVSLMFQSSVTRCLLWLVLLFGTLGCSDAAPNDRESGRAAKAGPDPPPLPPAATEARYEPKPKGTITFNRDVAPIIFDNCSVCHRPGEAAPFSLLSYDDVRTRARQIAAVTADRFMPPWLPDPGYVEFADDRSLTAEEIGTIGQWVGHGTTHRFEALVATFTLGAGLDRPDRGPKLGPTVVWRKRGNPREPGAVPTRVGVGP